MTSLFIIYKETCHKHSTLFYAFKAPNLCKDRLMYFCMQLQRWKVNTFGIIKNYKRCQKKRCQNTITKDEKINTFGIINRIKHFFLGNIVIYEALGQVILRPKIFPGNILWLLIYPATRLAIIFFFS